MCAGPLTLAGRFALRERLGAGGQGYVCRAWDRKEAREVAVKIVDLQQAADWKALTLFERSSRWLQVLDHPGVARLYAYEHHVASARHYQAREYFAGGSLLTRYGEAGCSDRKRVHQLLRDLLATLAYLHGLAPALIHRDIKPSNVMFRSATDEQPVLVDFDTAQRAAERGTGATIVGSPGYTAPEQWAGAAVPASDLYSLGVTMLFVLSGSSPDQLPRRAGAIDAAPVLATLEPATRNVLSCMIEPDLGKRYRSAREALRDLKGLSPRARPSKTAPDNRRWLRSGLRIALAVILGALIQYGIWLHFYRKHALVIVEESSAPTFGR